MQTTQLSKWWQTESCKAAYARVAAKKKERAKKTLASLLAWKRAKAERIAALDREIWKGVKRKNERGCQKRIKA
jgi:hypothetical protein